MKGFKQWVKEHSFEIFLGGMAIISMATLLLMYKKYSEQIIGDVWDKGRLRGFNRMCEYLEQEGHKEVLDDLIAKGLVIERV
jgi:hypothetical protein